MNNPPNPPLSPPTLFGRKLRTADDLKREKQEALMKKRPRSPISIFGMDLGSDRDFFRREKGEMIRESSPESGRRRRDSTSSEEDFMRQVLGPEASFPGIKRKASAPPEDDDFFREKQRRMEENFPIFPHTPGPSTSGSSSISSALSAAELKKKKEEEMRKQNFYFHIAIRCLNRYKLENDIPRIACEKIPGQANARLPSPIKELVEQKKNLENRTEGS